MKKRRLATVSLCLAVFTLSSCASFSGAVVPETGGASDPGNRSNVTVPVPRPVRFQFPGWRSGDALTQRKRLEDYGLVANDNAADLLVVLLEQEETTGGGWRLLNLLVTALSSLVIPFYNQVNRRIEYRLYHGDQLRCQFAVHTRNDELFGILMVPASPFFWPPRKRAGLEIESADLFTKHCLKEAEKTN